MRYIIANWKMNMNFSQVNDWLKEFEVKIQNISTQNTIIIAPSYLHTPFVSMALKKYPNVKIAAQNVSLYDKGAHTGYISIEQIKEFCDFCILGHSELQEDFIVTIEKTKKCVENSIIPITCNTAPLSDTNLRIFNSLPNQTLVAWEDPNNISKDGVYNEKPLEEVKQQMNALGSKIIDKTIIYGGSVNEKNSQELAKIEKLSGVLVGNASLKVDSFLNIVKSFK